MRVVFMGSADVSCALLEALLAVPSVEVVGAVTQPDRPSGRHRSLTPCPGKALALARGLPVIAPEKVNDAAALAQLAAWTPDAIVVVAYGQFLGGRLLALPRLGCINIHFSLLPRHRGAAPVQWAIAAGDAETGVTAMLMDRGMDSGDILGQVSEPIRPDDTASRLFDRLALLGGTLLVQTLAAVAAGRATRTPQDASRATLAPKLHKEDGRIDWRRPSAEITRRLRAFNPWPGSFTTLPPRLLAAGKGGRFKVLRVEPVPVVGGTPAPGAVCAAPGAGPVIGTADGWLRLLEVQHEGGKPMDGRAFLCGHPLQPGDVLGAAASG